jgi:2-haloacid dehalogenase
LPASLKSWKPFPDTVSSLESLKTRFKLAIISNTDDDLFAATARHLKITFDEVITAQQASAYKPALKPFQLAMQRLALGPDRILHVGQSMYHDVIPAKSLGIKTVWVNRRPGQQNAVKSAAGQADMEVPDMKTLARIVMNSGARAPASEDNTINYATRRRSR